MKARDAADPAETKEIDAALDECVPGLLKDFDTVTALIKSLPAIEEKAQSLVANYFFSNKSNNVFAGVANALVE